jgi:hypothetical protein
MKYGQRVLLYLTIVRSLAALSFLLLLSLVTLVAHAHGGDTLAFLTGGLVLLAIRSLRQALLKSQHAIERQPEMPIVLLLATCAAIGLGVHSVSLSQQALHDFSVLLKGSQPTRAATALFLLAWCLWTWFHRMGK